MLISNTRYPHVCVLVPERKSHGPTMTFYTLSFRKVSHPCLSKYSMLPADLGKRGFYLMWLLSAVAYSKGPSQDHPNDPRLFFYLPPPAVSSPLVIVRLHLWNWSQHETAYKRFLPRLFKFYTYINTMRGRTIDEERDEEALEEGQTEKNVANEWQLNGRVSEFVQSATEERKREETWRRREHRGDVDKQNPLIGWVPGPQPPSAPRST